MKDGKTEKSHLRPRDSFPSASAIAASSASRSSLKMSTPRLEDVEFDEQEGKSYPLNVEDVKENVKFEEKLALQKQLHLTKVRNFAIKLYLKNKIFMCYIRRQLCLWREKNENPI